tara:strand:+ start:974 stop:1945 length:972 start_codon:yes stop_codon:yes gene_type:complete
MKVRITHLDGKLPNLALMKLSAWHKSRGDEVHFWKTWQRDMFEPEYDRVYGSCIFGWTKPKRDRFKAEFPNAIIGGTGSGSNQTVEDVIGQGFEHYDYDIYPWFPSSIGFSQRGCRLKCSFCVVPKKEGGNRDQNRIEQIWRGGPHPRQIHLLDNDFFGAPSWEDRAKEIIDGDYKVCFSQGINIRLIHKEGAEYLNAMKYRDDQFRRSQIYTAWDNGKDEKRFFKGLEILTNAGIKVGQVMVYMLVGYWPGETMDDIFYRFDKLVTAGVLPYPMVYDNNNKELKRFQRWVLRRYYKFIPFKDYNANARGSKTADPNQMEMAI